MLVLTCGDGEAHRSPVHAPACVIPVDWRSWRTVGPADPTLIEIPWDTCTSSPPLTGLPPSSSDRASSGAKFPFIGLCAKRCSLENENLASAWI